MNSLIAAEPPATLAVAVRDEMQKTLVGGGGAGRELRIIHSVRETLFKCVRLLPVDCR